MMNTTSFEVQAVEQQRMIEFAHQALVSEARRSIAMASADGAGDKRSGWRAMPALVMRALRWQPA